MLSEIPVIMKGRVEIFDDGEKIRDVQNAIHPQNMARIIARCLSGEQNSSIYRMAFGNGGTTTDAALHVHYKPANDGQPPDDVTWDSRLYNETYSEICYSPVGTTSPLVGTDPGSADMNTGLRPGGGAVPADDSTPNSVASNEVGLLSEVIISVTLNSSEPRQQSMNEQPTKAVDFRFDEIGLYTAGNRAIATTGYQQIEVGNKTSTDKSMLVPGTTYSFNLKIDSSNGQVIFFTCPTTGGSGPNGEILFGDICEALNTGDPTWHITPAPPLATISITDTTGGTFPSITGAQTFGFLQFDSPTSGPKSRVSLEGQNTSVWLNSLNAPFGSSLVAPVDGTAAGAQNDPLHPANERERLLTHLIFTPVTKTAGRTLNIKYTLSVMVARSTPHTLE